MVEWLSLPCFIVLKIFTPPTKHQKTPPLLWWTGGGQAYKWFCFFENCIPTFKNIFFSNVFSYQGEHISFFVFGKRINFRAYRSKKDPKIDTFGQIDSSVLAIMGYKKVNSWTLSQFFLELFMKCPGIVFDL